MVKSKNVDDYPVGQPNPFDTYLKMNGYTRYKLSKHSGMSTDTLLHVARRKVENMEGKYYIFIGKLVKKKSTIVFQEMMSLQDAMYGRDKKYKED